MGMLMFGALLIMLLIFVPLVTIFFHEKGHAVKEFKHGATKVKTVVRANWTGDTTVTEGKTSQKPEAQAEILSEGMVAELRFIVFCLGAVGFFSSFEFGQWVVIQIVAQLGIWLCRPIIVAVLFEGAEIAIALLAVTALAILAVMFGTAVSPGLTRLVVAWREQALGSLGFLSPISQLCLLVGGIAGVILWLKVALGGCGDGSRIRKLQGRPNKPASRRRLAPAKRLVPAKHPASRRQPTASKYINQR